MILENQKRSKHHIVLLDLHDAGHHRSYLEILCRYWIDSGFQGQLTVVTTNHFARVHEDFCNWIQSESENGLVLHLLDLDVNGLSGWKGLLKANSAHKKAMLESIKLNPDHIVCMFFDHCQRAIATAKIPSVQQKKHVSSVLRDGPTPYPNKITISGIYFRASFHYPILTWKNRVQNWRKWVILKSALSNMALTKLFCLDPDAPQFINDRTNRNIALSLPDGTVFYEADESPSTMRARLKIADSAQIVLLIGSLDERKGVYQAITAFSNLPETLRATTVLVLAGKSAPEHTDQLRTAVEAGRQFGKIVWIDEYISNEGISSLLDACDIVLVPYQYHIGSSGILIRAAAALKPVIGSDFGMVGRVIEREKLGVTVNSESAKSITGALTSALQCDIPNHSQTSSKSFAQQNEASRFAKAIFEPMQEADPA